MKRLYALLIPVCAVLLPSLVLAQGTCNNPTATITALPYNTPNHALVFNDGFTTCGEGDQYNTQNKCGGTMVPGEDAVFKYVPKTGDDCITITLAGTGIGNSPNLNATATLSIMEGCPDNPNSTCVASRINAGGANLTIANLVLSVGGNYYIIVDGGSACYGYKLTVARGTCSPPPPTGGPGTDCGNPVEITFPYNEVPGSTAGMKADYAPGTGCIQAGNSGEDIVYHFTLAQTSCIRYNLSNMNTSGTMYLAEDCPGTAGTTCIRTSACNLPLCDGNIVEEMTLPAGDYYIVIKGNQPLFPLSYYLTVDIGNQDDDVICQTCNDEDNCSSCKNVGFEKMTLQGWVGGHGYWGTPALVTGFLGGPLNNIDSRHTIMTKGNYDLNIESLPATSPFGGDYSIRLGNDKINEDVDATGTRRGDAESVYYTFVVDSNNTNFIYDYAVVFQSPSDHGVNEQPFFSITLEVDGTKITCGSYEVSALTPTGFISGPTVAPRDKNGNRNGNETVVFYKNWTRVNIPLLEHVGKTAKITFVTKDCERDGHFGYAYLDAQCARLEILRDSNLLCNPDTVHLSAPSGFKSYQWNTGATTQSIDAIEKGVYTVTCTTVTDCKIVLTTEIKYEQPPIPNFTFVFDCKDSTYTFTDASTPQGTNPITSWTWSFGDGDSAFVKNPKHKYTVPVVGDSVGVTLTLGSAGGCISDTSITIPVDLYMPQGQPNCIDTVRLCEKNGLQLYADSIEMTKYEWKGPGGYSSTQVNPFKDNVLPKDSGYYRLKITIKDCVVKNDSTYVIIEPLKKIYVTPDTIICQGDTAKLFAAGGKTYQWSPTDSLSSSTIHNPRAWPDTTTIYSVTMFNDLCPDTTIPVQVRVLSGVVSMQMPDTLRACIGGNIPLQASVNGFDVFTWKGPGNFSSFEALPTVSNMDASKVGYYRLDCSISTNTCLIGADSTWLDLYPNPTITISPRPAIICLNDSIQLTASGAASYTWAPSQGVTNVNIANPYFKPTISRRYTVTGTSQDNCKSTDTITVIVNQLPTPNLGPDKLFCIGDTGYVKTTLQYDSLLWSTGAKTDSIMVTTDITVGVTAYRLGCVGYDTLKAVFQDPGLFTLGPDTLLCTGTGYYTGILLSPIDSARWNDNVTTLNRTIFNADTFSVKIYAGKCIYEDTIIVSFDSIPFFNVGPDSTVCIGSTVLLDATPQNHGLPLSYQWSTGAVTPTITVNSSGVYGCTVTSNRCSFYDEAVITVVDPPVLDIGPDRNICDKDSVVFQSNVTGDKYQWSSSPNDTLNRVTAKIGGAYSLIVQYGPCTLYDTANLIVQPQPSFTLGPDQTLCEDQTITVNGPTGYNTYNWSSGQTTRNISPTQSGSYILVARMALCTARDTINVTFDTIPNFAFEPLDTICQGQSLTISSPIVASNYLWSTSETTYSIDVDSAGFYSLLIVNGTCSYTDSIELFVVQPPGLDIGKDSVVCIGTGVRFGQFIPQSTYQWSTGETTPFIEDKKDPQFYSVAVTYRDVCLLMDSAELVVTQMPQPDLGPDLYICEGTVVNLFANTFGDNFNWNTPSEGSSAAVSQQGWYKVVVTNGKCVNEDSLYVKVQPKHLVMIPPDITICSNEKYDIVPVTDCQNPIFLWSTGDNTGSITVRKTGDYVISVANGVCEAKDTITVTVAPLPNIEPIYRLICPDDSIVINLPDQYTYLNQVDGSVFTDSVFESAIEYNLFVIDSLGCRWQTSIKTELDMDCERDIFVPNSFTPNGDGANDMFFVEAFELKLIELSIFDRWGHLVFHTFVRTRVGMGNTKVISVNKTSINGNLSMKIIITPGKQPWDTLTSYDKLAA